MELNGMFKTSVVTESRTYIATNGMSITDEEANDPKTYPLTKKQMFELIAGKSFEEVKVSLLDPSQS